MLDLSSRKRCKVRGKLLLITNRKSHELSIRTKMGDLEWRSHVRRTVSRCFATVRQLRTIRRQAVFQSLVTALVLLHLDYCNSMLYGLATSLIRRLQSVQNATTRLIFGLQRSEYISPALISLHWLCIPERISCKLAVLTYQAIHGAGPSYFQSCFTRVADMPSRRRLRSSVSDRLHVPIIRRSTVGSRTFTASGAAVWNDLPAHLTATPSLAVFRQRLKIFLFSRSYPDIVS